MSSDEVIKKLYDINPQFVFCHEKHYDTLSESNYEIINLDKIHEKGFLEHLTNFSCKDLDVIYTSDDSVAVYYYSSGTTGKSKIIEYTHKSMVLMQASMLRADFGKSGKVHLCFLPLGHTASLRYTVKHCICTGGTVVLYDSFWKLRSKLWDEIEKYNATFMQVVPSILIAILNTPYKNFSKKQINSMTFVGCGSAFLPENIQDNFQNLFKLPVANLYGLSETGATHFDNPFIKNRLKGSIGKPFDIVEAKIFDENGHQINGEKTGEIGIKGPGLLNGYLKNELLYKECFNKGFFMTGDLCYKNKDGIYFYVDRKKDLIIKGGVNIVPSQIEEFLLSFSFVKEVAVLGKPDMLFGETILCYIVPKGNKSINISTLKNSCKEKLGEFKTPSEFKLLDYLPKGPSGKILKRELRSNYLETK